MTKREMIDQIRRLNPTAPPEFLAEFGEQDLVAYLQQLRELECERGRHAELELTLTC